LETVALLQKNGFVQMYIAKVQPEPAKMSNVKLYTICSDEVGFGNEQFKPYSIGEKYDI